MNIEAKNSVVPATTTDGTYLGDLVAWDLDDNVNGKAGFSVPRADVKAAFNAAGFGGMITDVDPGDALAECGVPGTGIKVGVGIRLFAFDRPNKDTPVAIGVYRKTAVNGESGDDFVCVARARIDSTTGTAVALPPEGSATTDAEAMEIAQRVADKANEIVANTTNRELSHALCAVGRQLGWAKYKAVGGVWFVPAGAAERFRIIFDALEPMGGFYSRLTPMFSDGAGLNIRHAKAASKAALEEDIAAMRDDLDKLKTKGLRASTVEDRVRGCAELLNKCASYRGILAEATQDIEAAIIAVRDEFAKSMNGAGAVAAFAGIDAAIGDTGEPAKKPKRATKKAAQAPADDGAEKTGLAAFDIEKPTTIAKPKRTRTLIKDDFVEKTGLDAFDIE
jgi:hypothetical protein